jgi:Ca-activated chloride channel family protein
MRTVAAGLVFWLGLGGSAVGQGLEVRGAGAVRIEIAHVRATVEVGVARVEVDETFRNATGAVQEGVYAFKLPEDAVIGWFSMWITGREKRGRVMEAGRARAVYDSIVRRRRDPGLVEQIGWRQFRLSVFPIPAHETVRVKLVCSHVVRDDLGLETIEIALPEGAGPVGDLRVEATVRASRGIAGIDCPSHRQAILEVGSDGAAAKLRGDGVQPAGPFVLRVIPRRARAADGAPAFEVTLLAHRDPGAAGGWFLARVVPRLAEPPRIGRDLVFVIDWSGSMLGGKIEQARAALAAGLDSLKPGDRFDVVSFSTDVTSLGQGRLLDATPDAIERAKRAARDLAASGGTNLGGALAAAVAAHRPDAQRFAAILLLTDGNPTVGETDPERILASWRELGAGVRLFAFGVGDDVKDFLLTKLVAQGRGDARYVREGGSLEVPLAALFDRIRTPLLLDPELDVESADVTITEREPRRLPDLFQGRPLLVAGRFSGAGRATLHLRGRAGASEVKVDVPVELPQQSPPRPHVAQIWAKARVERLLDDLRSLGPNEEIRSEILALGLEHQLVTPYTSFLVVEDEVRLADAAADPPPPDQSGESEGTVEEPVVMGEEILDELVEMDQPEAKLPEEPVKRRPFDATSADDGAAFITFDTNDVIGVGGGANGSTDGEGGGDGAGAGGSGAGGVIGFGGGQFGRRGAGKGGGRAFQYAVELGSTGSPGTRIRTAPGTATASRPGARPTSATAGASP